MTQSEKYNPNSLTQLVRDRIDKKSRGEFVQLKPPPATSTKSVFSPGGADSSLAQQDLVTEFTASLLGYPAPSNKPGAEPGRFTPAQPSREHKSANPNGIPGSRTNSPLDALNKQEVSVSNLGVTQVHPHSGRAIDDSEQTFDLDTDYAGLVSVKVKRNPGAVEVTVNLRKDLTQKGQGILVQLLQTQLGSNLGLPVEVKIECTRS